MRTALVVLVAALAPLCLIACSYSATFAVANETEENATLFMILNRQGAFEEAAENPGLNEDHVRLLLKNPGLDAALVERISREPRFFKRGLLRLVLVSHPRLPRVRALEMIPFTCSYKCPLPLLRCMKNGGLCSKRQRL